MRFLRLLTFYPFLLLGSSPAVLYARAQGFPGKVLTDEVDALSTSSSQIGLHQECRCGRGEIERTGPWNVEIKGYRIAAANGTKVTENTRFGIGSNSKVRRYRLIKLP
jgi:hypothetical protein